jgi:hypothetical protein
MVIKRAERGERYHNADREGFSLPLSLPQLIYYPYLCSVPLGDDRASIVQVQKPLNLTKS